MIEERSAGQGAAPSSRTSGVQHVALRSADVARARAFYVDALGFPLLMESAEQFVVLAGGTSVRVRAAPAGAPEAMDAEAPHLGVQHLSLCCESDGELARIVDALAAHGIASSAGTDELFERRLVAFRDPDGVRWEVYVS